MGYVVSAAGAHVPWHIEVSQAVQAALEGIAGALLGLAIAIGIYALGSFLLMRRHVPVRGRREALRELVRELSWAAVSQPLIPLFYLLGRRFGRGGRRSDRGSGPTAAGRSPVVFVHGYMQNRAGFFYLARALGRRGLGPLYGFNYPWFSSIPRNAARLARFVAKVCAETGAASVDLVCHSMGGLVAMEMMRREGERAEHGERVRVRRCVTIATPHAGVVWRGPILGFAGASLRRGSKLLDAHARVRLAVPTLSIYSSHDNVVHPKETSQLAARGGRDLEVAGLAHLAILFSPAVAAHVADFLREPDAPPPAVLGAVTPEELEASEPERPDGESEGESERDEMKIPAESGDAHGAGGKLEGR
jgi:pimeloyl-ACP methyl ester carboxylesterase